jgi:tetratricopeptide (TPR) repeat protein
VALMRRQVDLARALVSKVLELEPDFGLGLGQKAQILCLEGDYERAIEAWQRACPFLAPGGLWGPGLMGYVFGRWGRREEACRIRADLEILRERSYAQATALAAVHAGLGENAEALEWLEQAFEEHCGGLVLARYDPTWDSLREEPRFQALLRKMYMAG